MNRKRKLGFLLVFVVVIAIWWLLPVKVANLQPDEVSEIHIFNGNTGQKAKIHNAADIEHIISNLNTVRIVKHRVSLLYMGYSYEMTVFKSNGEVYDRFIINSESVVRKDPFFYKVSASKIDLGYIEEAMYNNLETEKDDGTIDVIEERKATLEPSNVSQIVIRTAVPEKMAEDFEFSLKYGVDSKNIIDTYSDTITKDLIEDGTASISYDIDEDLKSEIYDELKHIHIEQYPTFFQSPYKYKKKIGKELGGLSHFSTYILKYRVNGESYTVIWDDEYPGESSEDLMGDELRQVLMRIIRYIEATEEFKSLPEIKGGYV